MCVQDTPSLAHRRDRQRGMALILAIAMLLLLSILGATVLDVVSRDVRATGQVDVQSMMFGTVDRAVSFGQSIADAQSASGIEFPPNTVWPITDPTGTDVFRNMESGTVTFLGVSKFGRLGSKVIADVYRIDAIATDNAPGNPTRIGVNMAFAANIRPEPSTTQQFGDAFMREAAAAASAGK